MHVLGPINQAYVQNFWKTALQFCICIMPHFCLG